MPKFENPSADLLLSNATVLTMNSAQPRADAVAIKNGRVLAVGSLNDLELLAGAKTRRYDCKGMTLVPGFHDAHCHFLALASRQLQLDCSADKAPSIPDLIRLISQESHRTPQGRWIRAAGYDEDLLRERRHPTSADLDHAAPDHPVRLDHRTGHATVLNTAAMKLLGIGPNFQSPPHGVVLRDQSGFPTGVFLEMTSEISRMMSPFRKQADFEDGAKRANELLLSNGITSIQDAGHTNGLEQWRTFQSLKRSGALTPRTTMMIGLPNADDHDLHEVTHLDAVNGLRLGAIKVMLTAATGKLQPPLHELTQVATHHHRKGRQLAFHAIEAEAVIAAAQAISDAGHAHPRKDPRHRFEHCAEAPPEILRLVRESGAMVVTQPGFIHHRGDKYLDRVDPGLLPHLYPLADLDNSRIPWAAGSDAPITPPHPLLHIQAAALRRTSGGRTIGPQQAVPVTRALRAWTINAAHSCFQEKTLGSITSGKHADFALLTGDPTQTLPDKIGSIEVAMTMIGGRIVWEA